MSRAKSFFTERFGLVTSLLLAVLLSIPVIWILWGQPGAAADLPAWLLPVTLLAGSVLGAGALAVGLRAGRAIVGDRVEVALRVPGEKKWRHGRLTVMPDGLRWEPYRWQARIPTGERIALREVELGEDTGRRPPLRTLWSINPALHIIGLGSDQGDFELAVLPSHLERLREQIRRATSEQDPGRWQR